MKKLALSILILFSLFAFSACVQSTGYAVPSDRVAWWQSTADDSGLREKFNQLNAKYFEGKLRVKYIRYGHGLLADGLTAATYYWNKECPDPNYADCNVITVDDEFFVTYPDELEGCLLHEMCHVYANMNDPEAQIPGIDGHQLTKFKEMMQKLIEMGANPRTGEGYVPIN